MTDLPVSSSSCPPFSLTEVINVVCHWTIGTPVVAHMTRLLQVATWSVLMTVEADLLSLVAVNALYNGPHGGL